MTTKAKAVAAVLIGPQVGDRVRVVRHNHEPLEYEDRDA